MLRIFHFFVFWMYLSWKGVEFCQSFCCMERIMWISFLCSVNVLCYFRWFCMLNLKSQGKFPLDHSVQSFYLAVGSTLLIFCWRFLHLWFISILSVILACNFPFLGYLFDFDIRIMLALFNNFGSVLPSSKFWNSLRSINVEFSLNVWWNSPVKTHGSGLLYWKFSDYWFSFITGNHSFQSFC